MSIAELSVNNFTPLHRALAALLSFPTLARARVADIVLAQTEEPWELMLSLTALLWGAWVLMFDVFNSSPTYYVLSTVAPRTVIGAWVLGVGLIRFLLLVYRVAPWRQYFSVVSLCTWFFLWLTFVFSNPASTATVIYLLPLCASVLVFWRLGHP